MVNKINKQSKKMLDRTITVLNQAYSMAVDKEDIESVVAIADRLMLLYQHMDGKPFRKKFKTGFTSLIDEEDDDTDTTD